MTIKTIAIILLFTFLATNVSAQNNQPWKGKKCAVVLTYDDGLDIDITNVLPALDSLGLKGTFYVADYQGHLQSQIPAWRAAAAKGHELGNHTLFHPCEGGRPGREFVTADYDMNKYSMRRITNEILAMNAVLTAIDGKTNRTFAFPCGDNKIHDTAYLDSLRKDFTGARGVAGDIPTIDHVDLYNMPGYGANNDSGESMIQWVMEAEAKRGLLVIVFHGVGGGHDLNVSLHAHSVLLHYLKQHEKDIWIAPMVEVATFIRDRQKREL
ncbi:polysaccharide deacetylase [Niastella koreensis]|uniref:Polysaccharide deacetylase n=2 Tax=Niastella koreensis TaxID=354356 RepID=G8TA33_NIAKG|nr:polysaccharide deacetylase family protein [Niastella koreensis]AEW02405.1 polysaccharide deacetylase [Niastella koreensis GR20-10]OQP54783.1 polysaccharide deacetylase [Niastella koreensis]